MEADLEHLDATKLAAIEKRLLAERERRYRENQLAHYKPYEPQREFHAAGLKHRERLFMASNQSGKSLAGAYELAIYATGRYPDWWTGRRFDRPVVGWACGTTNEVVRDTVQRHLLGRDGKGTGCIPRDCIVEIVPARGIADLADIIRVKHANGGVSTIALKSYISGRERFVGETLDVCFLDEEPDIGIYTEVLTRTNITSGPVYLTFTPLLGASEVVRRFILEKHPDRSVTQMTIDDAEHFTPEQREQIASSYPEHERDARTRGIPSLGSGRAFTTPESKLLVEPFECPKHFLKLGALDFGWTHFAAFVEMWWDRDLDVVYLARTVRMREKTPHQHIEQIRSWGLHWAWPHDGRNSTLAGAGVPLKDQYQDGGLDMMFEHATFPDGSTSVEAGILMMADRMRGDRWKVFKGQNEAWLEEFRTYHRDINGMLVKKNDDAISASRYGMMMLRNGRAASEMDAFHSPSNTRRSLSGTSDARSRLVNTQIRGDARMARGRRDNRLWCLHRQRGEHSQGDDALRDKGNSAWRLERWGACRTLVARVVRGHALLWKTGAAGR
jgi:phage terminase large subunit-like protein